MYPKKLAVRNMFESGTIALKGITSIGLTTGPIFDEIKSFSTAERSERVENCLFRATCESTGRPDPRRRAAPGPGHASVVWYAAAQQV